MKVEGGERGRGGEDVIMNAGGVIWNWGKGGDGSEWIAVLDMLDTAFGIHKDCDKGGEISWSQTTATLIHQGLGSGKRHGADSIPTTFSSASYTKAWKFGSRVEVFLSP